ncbi:hypothetical protein [Sulfoacidibacillus ferrooxidans]|uniref:Uncharacterized protein n=1 Tax=Sulfoacidibacillus ferrooxidans TaxID=2005001 RepID=A0A9X1VB07_9BACL|nr:hypothetical protein [Sulfoacidibacillus ferrooxidans]MCI0184544.1 hypothetical protein [Sulfoacidibacillus ferrooxidans]
MCTKAQCEQHVGQWIQFRTLYGHHIGRIEHVTANAAIVVSPSQYVPQHLAKPVTADDESKLDMVLAFWPGGGYPRVGYGGATGSGYGIRSGQVNGYGWQRWAVSFLIIYALWGLWFW